MASTETVVVLAALVDASLIQTEIVAGGIVRFSMLELIRDYALQRRQVQRRYVNAGMPRILPDWQRPSSRILGRSKAFAMRNLYWHRHRSCRMRERRWSGQRRCKRRNWGCG